MKKIYIKTTEKCQLQCKHCYIGDNRNQEGFFNEDNTISWLKSYIEHFNLDEKEILFSFHGGEPFLCELNKMQKVIDAFPNATFDATSNLIFFLIDSRLYFIKNNFIDKYGTGKSFIKTSWDHKIRFNTKQERHLWEQNILILLDEEVDIRVIICLTSLLIDEVKPEELLKYLLKHNIKDINFERLTMNTTADKSLVPKYDKQDEWLLEFYELSKDVLTVDMFEELKHACNHVFINCRKRRCMSEVITINANGTIGGCPNSAITKYYTTINNHASDINNNSKLNTLIKNENTFDIGCLMCDLYKICNGDCHQLSWQGDVCATPKKLLRRIRDDMEREKKIIIPNA